MRPGALIPGHSHSAIAQAVQEQMAKGVHYGENHELEVWNSPDFVDTGLCGNALLDAEADRLCNAKRCERTVER